MITLDDLLTRIRLPDAFTLLQQMVDEIDARRTQLLWPYGSALEEWRVFAPCSNAAAPYALKHRVGKPLNHTSTAIRRTPGAWVKRPLLAVARYYRNRSQRPA